MILALRVLKGLALTSVLLFGASSLQAVASTSLSNPAAEFCIASGGLYGVRDTDNGRVGICVLEDGEQVDAWDHFRESMKPDMEAGSTEVVNPAAAYCAAIGGTYSLATSSCTLADGTEVDAWAMLRAAHARSSSIANPAATYCLEQGGAYEIRQTDRGQVGICTLADGTEMDAWELFRRDN